MRQNHLLACVLLVFAGTACNSEGRDNTTDIDIHDPSAVNELPSQLTIDLDGSVYESKFEILARSLLQQRARNREEFQAALQRVYGDHNVEVAEQYRQLMATGDFSWQPPVRIVRGGTLGNTFGAYSASQGIVYLDEDAPDTPARALVLLEEVGHHLDTLIRTTDAEGDEGALFRRTMMGEQLNNDEIASIRAINDHATIYIDGEAVEIEQWWGSKAWKAVTGGLGSAAKTVGETLVGAASATWHGAEVLGGWIASEGTGVLTWIPDRLKSVFLANVFSAVLDLVVLKNALISLGYGAYDGIKTLGEGIEDIAAGNFTDGIVSIFVGIAQLAVEVPLDAVSTIGVEGLRRIQERFGLEPVGRSLKSGELAMLYPVFRNSVDFRPVTIKDGFSGIFSVNGRPFTMENTVYMKNTPAELRNDVLVHETVHVWQFQHGGTDYKLHSLAEQAAFGNTAYDWAPACSEGTPWNKLNCEQQAKLIEDGNYLKYIPTTDMSLRGDPFRACIKRGWRELLAGRGAP